MLNILLGALALGLLWAVATIGIYLSYRVLDMADLSVEGTIVTGASAAAIILSRGGSPLLATLAATTAGGCGGLITGFLHTKMKIPALLSGILCMIAMYSVNIRIMGGSSNVSLLRIDTLLSPLMGLGLGKNAATIVLGLLCAALVVGILYWFLKTERGFALRATGANPAMARSQGINTDHMKMLGLVLSNALVGLAGGLIAQYQGFADVQMGTGAIVIGLASLIIGEVLFGRAGLLRSLLSLVAGAVVYRIIIALVIEAGMPATDLKLFTALTVAVALYLPTARDKLNAITNRQKETSRHAEADKRPQNLQPQNRKRTGGA